MSVFNEIEILKKVEIELKLNSVKKWVNDNCDSNMIITFESKLSDYLKFTPQNDYILVEGSCTLYINTSNVPSYIKFNTLGVLFKKCAGDIPIYSLTPGYHYSVYITDCKDNINLAFPDYHLDINSLFIRECENVSLDIPADNLIYELSIYGSKVIKYNILCNVDKLNIDSSSAKSLLHLFMENTITNPDNIKIY